MYFNHPVSGVGDDSTAVVQGRPPIDPNLLIRLQRLQERAKEDWLRIGKVSSELASPFQVPPSWVVEPSKLNAFIDQKLNEIKAAQADYAFTFASWLSLRRQQQRKSEL